MHAKASASSPDNSARTSTTDDAHPLLQTLAHELREVTLALVWRQWRALGAAAATRAHAQTLIDPEALVLMSLVLLPDEPRLADVLHDWAVYNSDLLSVQRMNNLADDYPDTVEAPRAIRVGGFARVALEVGKDLRWRTLAQDESSAIAGGLPAGRTKTNKIRAIRVRFTEPAALVLRLRIGLGVGVKADLLTLLLGIRNEWATIRDMADATGYTVAAVRRAADEMAAARLIQAREVSPLSYRAERDDWLRLLDLPEGLPLWGYWRERFACIVEFLAWAHEAQARPLSMYAFGVKGREFLEKHRRLFERDHIAVWSQHTAIANWTHFVEQGVQGLSRWTGEMG